MAQVVSIERQVGIGRIFEPLEPTLMRFCQQDRPGEAQPGPLDLDAPPLAQGRHAGQPPHAATAQCGQQESLDLVVGMLRQPQAVTRREMRRESLVTSLPSSRLDPLPRGIDPDRSHSQR